MGIKAESLMGSKEGIKVGHTGQRYVLSSQKSSCFHPTLSHLCRSNTAAPAALGTHPNSFSSCLSSGSQTLYLLSNTPLIKLFKHKVHRDGGTMRHRNYKKTIPQHRYLEV